jgi:hypothetical protein
VRTSDNKISKVRPGRSYNLAGGDPAEVRSSQPPRIESWRHDGNVMF